MAYYSVYSPGILDNNPEQFRNKLVLVPEIGIIRDK